MHPIYCRFAEAALCSISESQPAPLAEMKWVATVQHGMPRNLLSFNAQRGKYLAFIGRISPEKGIDVAIEVALRSGVPLKIAAKIDAVDREYFAAVIKPRIKPPMIEYIGEIDDVQKSEFLGGALALLFAIDWPEPFGLAMIEALACGTPVIARPCGSVPEIIRPGITGFLANEIDELVAAVGKIDSISRQQCRREFEERFASEVMIAKYEHVYHSLIGSGAIDTRIDSRQAAVGR
jgi:glycosyltransferase involved in cell wall biosynthesis